MSLDSLIQLWHTDPDTAPNFSIWRTTLPRPAQGASFPGGFAGLASRGFIPAWN